MKKIFVFLLLVSLIIPQVVRADGMIFPPPNQNVTQAQQKALIVHQNDKEDLIISLEFQGNASKFAWFLPVPNIPEIKRGEDEIFTKLGELTKPKKNLLEKIKGEREYWPMPLMGKDAAEVPTEEKVQVIETKRVGILDVTVLTATKAADLEEWLKKNGYQIPGDEFEEPLATESIEAIELEKAEGESPPDIKYRPRPTPQPRINKTRQIFQEYLDKGWYFVAAKIATEFLEELPQPISPRPLLSPAPKVPLPGEGGKSLGVESEEAEIGYYPRPPEYLGQAHITPLHLSFKTEKIVYPMKITSLGGSSPSVLLYVLADHKKEVSNYQYEYGGENDEENKFIFKTLYAGEIKGKELKEWLQDVNDGYLTKLYASYLDPTQMKEDLRFENATDDKTVATGEMRKKDWLVLPFYLAIYGPIRILEWISRGPLGYYPSSEIIPLVPLVLAGFLGGVSLVWIIAFYFLLARTSKRWLRVILYLLQFPGVWVLVNLLSLIFVIPCLVLMLFLKVDSGVTFVNLWLKNNFGAVFFTTLFYALQSRVHLIFKRKE